MYTNSFAVDNKFSKIILVKDWWFNFLKFYIESNYLFTRDLHITVNLYSLADFGQKLMSIGIVSLGSNVPNPSLGWTLTHLV